MHLDPLTPASHKQRCSTTMSTLDFRTMATRWHDARHNWHEAEADTRQEVPEAWPPSLRAALNGMTSGNGRGHHALRT